MRETAAAIRHTELVVVPACGVELYGDLSVMSDLGGLVLFAHGSGSSRFSPRDRVVAAALQQRGLSTLLIDLLTPDEETVDARTGEYRFDIPRFARRLVGIIDWLRRDERTASLPVGLFGGNTGAGAALIAAAERPADIDAVVSRGGRPDLARAVLARVAAPTLLIVGALDTATIRFNQEAMRQMCATVTVQIVPGATHFFPEPGALERVAELAGDWFLSHLEPPSRAGRRRPRAPGA